MYVNGIVKSAISTLIEDTNQYPTEKYGDETTLRISKLINLIANFYLVLGILILFILIPTSAEPNFPTFLIFVSTLSIIFLAIGIRHKRIFKNCRIKYSPNNITIINSNNKAKTIPWNDITSIKSNFPSKSISIKLTDNNWVTVRRYYVGFNHFLKYFGETVELDISSLIIK